MLEQNKMPAKPVVPEGTTKQTSDKGPHGGGTTYHQLAVGKDFAVQTPIAGHTQKKNVTPKT